VVLITQNRPLRDLYDALTKGAAGLSLVGDARQPRDLLRAIWEAHAAARAIA
jgi:hypothetical protein